MTSSFFLYFSAKSLECVVPEVLEVRADLRNRFLARAIQAAPTFPSLRHEAGLLQDAKVLRYRCMGYVETRSDVACRALGIPDEREDRAPARFGERLDGSLHDNI